jgi:hypothetical protein
VTLPVETTTMTDSIHLRERYASLARALPALAAEGRDTGRILAAAGALLRRRAAVAFDPAAVDAALVALSGERVRAWAATVDAGRVAAALGRATDDAALSAFAETEDERARWAAAAVEALAMRDELESAAVALARREELGGSREGAGFSQQLAVVDRALAGRARRLSGLNEVRRAERDLLDPDARARATWYSERAGCDGLVEALAGERITMGPQAAPNPGLVPSPGEAWAAHLRGCAACARDLAAGHAAVAPAGRHLSADDLLRYDLRAMSAAERARADHHADGCEACSEALSALADGERAIAEAEAAG